MIDTKGLVRVHGFFTGKVQGVCFRDFTTVVGRLLELSGTVENTEDGKSVEVFVEGDDKTVDLFLSTLKYGPRGARVDVFDLKYIEATGDTELFKAIYPPRPQVGKWDTTWKSGQNDDLPLFAPTPKLRSLCDSCQQPTEKLVKIKWDNESFMVCKECSDAFEWGGD